MKTFITLAAIALATFGAHAADKKTMQIESWSFGASNPSMTTSGASGACVSGDVKSPRDVASGQSSGQRVAGYDLKTAKGARMAAGASSCDQGTSPPTPQEVRESPSKASLGRKHELTGHVTLIK
jgi:hypothetical protein